MGWFVLVQNQCRERDKPSQIGSLSISLNIDMNAFVCCKKYVDILQLKCF